MDLHVVGNESRKAGEYRLAVTDGSVAASVFFLPIACLKRMHNVLWEYASLSFLYLLRLIWRVSTRAMLALRLGLWGLLWFFSLSKPGTAQRKVAVPVPGVAHHEDFASPQKLNHTEEHLWVFSVRPSPFCRDAVVSGYRCARCNLFSSCRKDRAAMPQTHFCFSMVMLASFSLNQSWLWSIYQRCWLHHHWWWWLDEYRLCENIVTR